MRMRKIPWAADYLKTSPSTLHSPSDNKGRWKEALNAKTLHVELGCGKGNYSLNMAAKDPDAGFVAVEKNENAAAIAAKKFDEQNLPNLILVEKDAADLEDWFEEGEVDVLHLNFSDPWPKKRNAKRRLSAPGFLKSYEKVLSENGEIQMKTDNSSLFEYSVLSFLEAGYSLADLSVDFRREAHDEDVMTEYEQKFVQAGQPIYRAVFRPARKDQ